MRDHPIPNVTEPFQYRAIGVVRGVYRPEGDEKFTRGVLIDKDGQEIDSVVLGRVIALMRRHLIVDNPHLWVVYPRCREAGHLHLQIAGVWEPSTLSKTPENATTIIDLESNKETNDFDELPEGDDYFSIRGELIYTRPENKELVIKVRQRAKHNTKKPLPFKLILEGEMPVDCLRNFVSLNIRRKNKKLVLEDYELIGSIPLKGSQKKRKVGLGKNKLDKS